MADGRKEISRVLSNPGNVILSDTLHDLLVLDAEENAGSVSDKLASAVLSFDEESFPCKIEKIVRHHGAADCVFMFVLFVPDMPIDVILDKCMCVLEVSNYKFCQLDHSSVKWENNHITIKARRILK